MAHNIENRDGVYSFAFTGERSEIWHKLGQELDAGAGRDEWLNAAGFNYHVEKVPAIASLNGAMFDHLAPEDRFVETDKRFTVRQDNGHVLGIAGEGYQTVQPVDVWEWFENYITVDDRFHINAKALIKTRHNTRFDGRQVHAELGQIAQSFVEFKALGDAMAQTEMTKRDVETFFTSLLGIPVDAKVSDISPRTKNIAADLGASYRRTQS